jgi:hypothetical protein
MKLAEAMIFGCGAGGLNCLVSFSKKYSIVAFVDNNPNIKFRFPLRIEIIHPSVLKREQIEGMTFIISSMETFSIIDQLVRISGGVKFNLEFPDPSLIYSPVGRLLAPFLIGRIYGER